MAVTVKLAIITGNTVLDVRNQRKHVWCQRTRFIAHRIDKRADDTSHGNESQQKQLTAAYYTRLRCIAMLSMACILLRHYARANTVGNEGCNRSERSYCFKTGLNPPALRHHRLRSTCDQHQPTPPPTFRGKQERRRRETPREAQGRRAPAFPCRPPALP